MARGPRLRPPRSALHPPRDRLRDGTVIHFVRARGASAASSARRWQRSPTARWCRCGPYRERLPVEEIVANAESRLGWEDYHLVRNNCEHLATWASTGASRSRQVRGWAMAAPSAFASIGVAAAGAHAVFLGGLSIGAYAVTRPLRRRRRTARESLTLAG